MEEMKPCEDCISRQAAIDAIWDGINMDIYTREVKECLEALPSVTPQQKIGTWIKCDVLQEVKCSECRKCFRHKTKYCPECGAKMQEMIYENMDEKTPV